MEPERLSLLDQMELRPDVVKPKKMIPKDKNKIFSINEIANAISLFEGAFEKYSIADTLIFKEVNMFLYEVFPFLKDDFNFVIEKDKFNELKNKYKLLSLENDYSDYFSILNNFSPFQNFGSNYYSTVVLISRFVYKTLSIALIKNKTFQIHSGFIFEDKVGNILKNSGFTVTGITRINHKEFDLITLKNNKIYNFQCKNNFIDISNVNHNYKKIGRLNRLLCRYYEKALTKEKQREHLVIESIGIENIEHFVVSRYPVITKNENIINFRDLEDWILNAC